MRKDEVLYNRFLSVYWPITFKGLFMIILHIGAAIPVFPVYFAFERADNVIIWGIYILSSIYIGTVGILLNLYMHKHSAPLFPKKRN